MKVAHTAIGFLSEGIFPNVTQYYGNKSYENAVHFSDETVI